MTGSSGAGRRRQRRWLPWLSLGSALLALQADRHLAADGPHFDFSRELAQATLEPETRFLDLGTRDARPYLLSGWSVDELWQGKTSFVWAMGNAATLRFTRFSPEPFDLYFRCRPVPLAGGATQTITTLVNGAAVGVTRLGPEFQSYRLAVPAADLRSGENRLELRFAVSGFPAPAPHGVVERRRLAVAWDWIGFGTAAPPPPRTTPSRTPQAAARAGSLPLPYGSRLDFYLEIQPGSRIRWQSVLPWGALGARPAPRLEVQVEWDGGGAPRTLRFPSGSFASPQSVSLENRDVALARIGFLAWSGREADGAASGLTLVAPELVGTAPEPPGGGLPGPAAGGAGGSPPGRGPGPPAVPPVALPASSRPNVVLYVIDTLRADHLGVYGYRRPISPEIDAFAAGATVFTHAYAQSGWTKSSVASILTGLHLPSHGVAEPADALPAALPTLPEMLRHLGYQTLAVTTNPAIAAESGFARGFDAYVGLYDRHPVEFVARGSEEINAELCRWLGARDRTRPFFAFLHAMDPHAPYAPPPPYRERFAAAADGALSRPGPREIAAALAAHPELTRNALKDNFEALYDAQIAHNDHDFGLLLERLRDLGLERDTMVVLVADHGEEFLDHGGFAHGHSLYQEILHVPLIVRWPGRRPGGTAAGRKVESAAQHVDLLPTILAAAGARGPAALPGVDLRLLALAETPVEREVTSDLAMAGTRISSLVARDMHLLVRESPNPDVELYDLRDDPRELRDLARPPGVRLGYLTSRLRRLRTLDDLESRGAGGAGGTGRTGRTGRSMVSSELAARLRALGYLR